ncbi:Hydrolase in polyol utilization gene cluster, haloacid dehalogenase-like family [hydrothermal vent metagenome]|uniref:Hydrolase in polyol utilization gene cluster, haloacid dehalogenase-like family n=1 Tax=hydrothermal vent metagenome TaxID=652676 RepID=A0A3B0TC09_9ZZZZ
MREIDLVIFDCDGVLIDSEMISARMLVAELANRNIDIDLAYVARYFLGRSYPVVLAQIRSEFGVELPVQFEADYRKRLLEAFEVDLRIVPGVRDVIAALNIPYCLATSSSPARLKRSLEIVGLGDVFGEKTTTAAEVDAGKPAPDLFLLAAKKMAVPPHRCLVIEDSVNGVRAGRAAGMQVWRFVGGSHLTGLDLGERQEAAEHRRFASFDEFFHLRPELRRSESIA